MWRPLVPRGLRPPFSRGGATYVASWKLVPTLPVAGGPRPGAGQLLGADRSEGICS